MTTTMMTDRELLEKAAKAAGISYHAYVDDPIFGTGINIGEVNVPLWNPLEDDAQAFRLAVKLRLHITFDDWSDGETVIVEKGRLLEAESIVVADPFAATRRAIVRAAAEIGRTVSGEKP